MQKIIIINKDENIVIKEYQFFKFKFTTVKKIIDTENKQK